MYWNVIFGISHPTTSFKYYKFDGVYGSGPDPNSYGFKFIPGNTTVFKGCTPGTNCIMGIELFRGGGGGYSTNDNTEIHHSAFVGLGPDSPRCINAIEGGGQYWFIKDSLFKGFDNPVHGFTFDLTVDDSWFTDIFNATTDGSSCHSQQISYNQDRLTVKNSTFIGCRGTACITLMTPAVRALERPTGKYTIMFLLIIKVGTGY
jgi:hypothetical protein